MILMVEINQSAFRHGIAAEDIAWTIDHFLFDEVLTDFDNKYLVIGFDTKGRLLEIMYNVIDDTSVNVFHAMKCRKAFYGYVGL